MLKLIDAITHIAYCEKPRDGFDYSALNKIMKVIFILGTLFRIWDTINFILDIGQAIRLVFSKYAVGGIFIIAGSVLGRMIGRQGKQVCANEICFPSCRGEGHHHAAVSHPKCPAAACVVVDDPTTTREPRFEK